MLTNFPTRRRVTASHQVDVTECDGGQHETYLGCVDKHHLRIAYSTLKMSDSGAFIMGGMTKDEARQVIYKLTGKRVAA
jgi:hypothetical protein